MSGLAESLRRVLELGRSGDRPLLRGDDVDTWEGETMPAAVLIAIVDRPEPSVILTERPATMRRHPGQISFPGGRIDPSDEGPIAAALREAEEEIALPHACVDVIGTVEPYRTITGFTVTPVLGVVPPDLALRPEPREVADIFEAPLRHLMDPRQHQLRAMEWRGSRRQYYEIDWQGRRIWGATAAMIVNLSRRLELVT
jgi:8-oxo-dGTP pyrophosphatase MutT (NUDIX family)